MRAIRSVPLAVALSAALLLGACSDSDPSDDTDDVAQPGPSDGSSGPLEMEPEDAGDQPLDGEDGGAVAPPPPGLDTGGEPMSPAALDRVEEVRAQWEALGVSSYEMVIEQICFCPTSGEMRVTVEDGVVTAASFTDPERTEEIMLEFAPTINQLLENAASNARSFEDVAVEIVVEDGVPVSGNADAPMVADEETVWTILEFTAL